MNIKNKSLIVCAMIAVAVTTLAQAQVLESRIAFSQRLGGSFCDIDNDIFIMKDDGSNQTNLTNHPESDGQPSICPGGKGIVFASDRDQTDPCDGSDVFIMRIDGSSQTNLTNLDGFNGQPDCGTDATTRQLSVLFVSTRDGNFDIYKMRANGTGVVNLTNDPAADTNPRWCGKRIVFTSTRDGNSEIYMMDPNGSNVVRLTNGPVLDDQPACSPDGTAVAWRRQVGGSSLQDIFVKKIVGGIEENITPNSPSRERDPSWSPTGDQIAFVSDRDADGDFEVFKMKSNGTGVTQLTFNATNDISSDWGLALTGF